MAMANSDLKTSVLMNLRLVTQSRKGGVPLKCLERDYRDLLGTPIPFRDLGYSSILAFLTDIPDVISLKQKEGQLIAEGVADSTTAHTVSLVIRQKTAKGAPVSFTPLFSKKEKLLCQYLGDIIVLTDIVSFLDVLSNIKELLNTEEDISQISFENITDSEEINLLDQLKLLVDPFKDATAQGFDSKDGQRHQESFLTDETDDHILRDRNIMRKYLLNNNTWQEGDLICYDDFPERRSKEDFLKYVSQLIHFLVVSDIYSTTEVNLLPDLFSDDDYFKTVAWEKSVKKLKRLIFDEETIKKAPNENTDVPLKRLARKLFDILNISEENCPPFIDLVSFLLYEMHHSEKTSLKETLDKIIEETEKILKDSPIYFKYVSKPPFHETNFSNILGIGIFIANRSCDALVEKILNLILEIDRGHSDFSISSSQSIIGYSMILAINPIRLYIEDIYSTCRFRSFSSIERNKSALNIIFTEYSRYVPPTPEYQEIKKSIDLLSQIDEKFCDSSDTE